MLLEASLEWPILSIVKISSILNKISEATYMSLRTDKVSSKLMTRIKMATRMMMTISLKI